MPIQCMACGTDNTTEYANGWECTCGWTTPSISEMDTPETVATKLDRAVTLLAERGMPVSLIRFGRSSHRLWRGFLTEPQTITLDDGQTYTLGSFRHLSAPVVIMDGLDAYACILVVNRPRRLPPQWLRIGTNLRRKDGLGGIHRATALDTGTGQAQITFLKGVETTLTHYSQVSFEDLRENWQEVKTNWAVVRGQIWGQAGKSTTWRVNQVGETTAHLLADVGRIVLLSELLGPDAAYHLIHDVPSTPSVPIAPPLRTPGEARPEQLSSDDILAGDDDSFP